MNRSFRLLGLLCFGLSPFFLFAQVPVIFDTDFGGDADDLGALAMLHYFVDQGECDLLAVMSWSQEQDVIPAIDAVNRFYDHPDVPLGVRKGDPFFLDWHYTHVLADSLPHEATFAGTPAAVELYRQILAAQPDSSVVIVTVGPLKNIEHLLHSAPDDLSPFTGQQLIAKKVRQFVIMGGKFPAGEGEWNFDGGMPGVTRYVLENLPVPVVLSGFELGVEVKTGATFAELPGQHPLRLGFAWFSEHAPWMKEHYQGEILDNATYDQTAVLYAIRGGEGIWWELSALGRCVAEANGDNRWQPEPGGPHRYLKLIVEPEVLAAKIEALMLHEVGE